MGMSTGNSGAAGGRRRRGQRSQVMSEINVTPFVDVMLVLLIIFMVAAPLLTVGVPIDLPESQAKALNAETQPINISINEEGQIFIQKTEILEEEIISKLSEIAKNGYEERIYVRGAKNANYGNIIRVMGLISQAGYKKLAMVTTQEQN